MTEEFDSNGSGCESAELDQADVTGRDRMVRNVLASWGAHFIFLIFGFVLPRIIDGNLGQEALGVWDFGWSLVGYFVLVQGGLVGSVNRYVSRYRAVGDWERVNRAVTSATCVLVLMAGVVIGLTVAASLAVPSLMGQRLGSGAGQAGWVVLFLGVSIAVQIGFAGFSGVLTGCHRWDLHNGIQAGAYGLTAAVMIVVLVLDGGLPLLAFVNLCGELLSRLLGCFFAYRVCPTLGVRREYVNRAQAREMLAFGAKGFVPHVGGLLLKSTTAMLIVMYLGPAALAVYARPVALVRQVRTLVHKFSHVFTPTASSLQAMDEKEQLRQLLCDATRYGAFVTLPLMATLAILGGPILRLWMGLQYEQGLLMAVLAIGHLAMMLQRPVLNVLAGLNAHGRPGLANLIAAISSIGLVYIALALLDWGLIGVALAVTIPFTIVNAVYVPLFACLQLEIPAGRFLLETLSVPALCVLGYVLWMIGSLYVFDSRPYIALACGLAGGAAILGPLYWRYALPASFKRRIASGFSSRSLGQVLKSLQ